LAYERSRDAHQNKQHHAPCRTYEFHLANARLAKTIEGTPQSATPVSTPTQKPFASEVKWIASVLPNAADLSRVLGGPEKIHEIDSLIGDVTDLRDTFLGRGEVTESQCIGVVSPLETRTFEAAPVRVVAYATQPDATLGAVALSSNEDARSLFNSFVKFVAPMRRQDGGQIPWHDRHARGRDQPGWRDR
jgi:hypothetical protein